MAAHSSTPIHEVPPDTSSRDSGKLVLTGPTTNYGNLVAFNHGSISNYFILDDVIHPCSLPVDSSSQSRATNRLYIKIESARVYHKSKNYIEAKVQLLEVLNASGLPDEARLIAKYDLARAHFAQFEFSEAAQHFEYVVNAHIGQSGTTKSTLTDSKYWLARSLFNQGKYEDASMYLQDFVISQDGNDVRQITKGRLWLGLTFERMELFDSAKEQIETALSVCIEKFGPENLETLASLHHMANFLYKRRDFREARKIFHCVLEAEERLSGPEKAEAVKTRCMLALCLAQLGRYDDAEPHLQRVLSRMKSDPDFISNELGEPGLVYYWLGRIALTHNDRRFNEEAGLLLNRALPSLGANKDLIEEYTDCRKYQAQAMSRQGQFHGAEFILRQIIEEDHIVDLAPAYFELAMNLGFQNKTSDAKEALERIVSVETPIDHCKHTGQDLASCLRLLGTFYHEREQYHDARDCFQKVVDVVPDGVNYHHNMARYWLGITLHELREFEDARKHLQIANELEQKHLRADPRYQIQAWLGWTSCELGLFDEVEHNLRPVVILWSQPDLTKDEARSHFVLGRSNYCLGRAAIHRNNFPEAVRLFQSALPMLARRFDVNHHLSLECRYHLACSYMRMRRYGDASPLLEELLGNQSQHVVIQDIRSILVPYWLCRVSFAQKQYQEAEGYIRKFLDAWGDESSYQGIPRRQAQLIMTQCLMETGGDMEECRELMQRAISDEPPIIDEGGELYAWNRFVLARVLYHSKRYEEAYENLRLAIPALEARLGHGSIDCCVARAYLADCLEELQRSSEAESLIIIAAEQRLRVPGDELVKAFGSFWLGRQAFNRGQFKEAEDRVQAAKSLFEGLVRKIWESRVFECRHFLARIHYEKKRYSSAQVLFRELAKQQYEAGHLAEAIDSQYYFGSCLYRQNKLTTANVAYQKITDDDHAGKLVKHAVPASYFYRGDCLYQEKDIESAKMYFEVALESPLEFPQKMRTRYFLARCLYQLKRYDEAITHFQMVTETNPRDAEWTFWRQYWSGRSHIELKNWPEARSHLQYAYELSHKKWRHASDCQYFLGQVLFTTQDYSGAKRHFQSLCETPGNLSKMTLSSDYYLGCCLLELGDLKSSQEFLLTGLEKVKEDSSNKLGEMTIEFQLARCLHRLKAYDEAESKLKSVRLFFESRLQDGNPTVIQIEYELGLIARRHERWEKAADFFQQALLKYEASHEEYGLLDELLCKSYLGMAFFELKRYEEALPIFQKVLEQRKESSELPHREIIGAQVDVIRTLFELNDFAQAAPLAKQALEWEEQVSGPEDLKCLPIRIQLGEILDSLSESEQAVTMLSRAAAQIQAIDDISQILSRQKEISFNDVFARALLKVGRVNEAKEYAWKASKLNGNPQTFDEFSEAFDGRYQKLEKDSSGESREQLVLLLAEPLK
ncbi:TPR-like protein [Annulohypoxylon nitens]|nr:TPR-like protein [Annulohypoxylon nitens]